MRHLIQVFYCCQNVGKKLKNIFVESDFLSLFIFMAFFKINSFPFTSVLQFIATDFWKAGLHRFQKRLIYNSDPLRYCFKLLSQNTY